MESVIRVTSGIMVAPALQLLARVYKSPLAVLAEYGDNGLDADASNIWITLEPNIITILDNGTGMVPDILAEDRKILDSFFQDAASVHEDIRQKVSPATRASLRWMVEYGAWSSKIQGERPGQRGVFGIGAMAFRMIANKAVWITKPNKTLQAAFWGTSGTAASTWILETPTNQELGRNVLENRIHTHEELTDPEGNRLPSGTKVVISELNEGVVDNFKPPVVVEYLSHRFGSDIRSGRLSIVVIDKTSVMGRRTRNGKIITVTPPAFRGLQIVDTTGHLKEGAYPFKAEIWFDEKGTNLRPQIVRKNASVGPITNIPDLDFFPWNSGQISGYIEWPDVPEREAPWESDKSKPLTSPTFSQWLRSVRQIAEQIEEAIDTVKRKAKEEELQQHVAAVAKAITAAMSNSALFNQMIRPPSDLKKKTVRIKVPKPVEQDDETRVHVVNEYGSPLRGVVVVLKKNKKEVNRQPTRISGTVNFGNLQVGRYSVMLELPKKDWKCEQNEVAFEIRSNQLRVKLTFNVITGEQKPADPNKLPAIILWPRAMGNDTQPYSLDRIQHGIIEINTNQRSYRRALLAGDRDGQIWCETLFASMAVIHYLFPNEAPEFLFERAVSLQSETLKQLGEKTSTKKRKP